MQGHSIFFTDIEFLVQVLVVPVSAMARLIYLHFCEIHPVLLSKDKQKLAVCKLAIENGKYEGYAS